MGREVTLLPRHWGWLATQRGGASATFRRLVDQARRESTAEDRARESQSAAYRFMAAMVGNEPGFEKAIRALFGGDAPNFLSQSDGCPPDLREHSRRLAAPAFSVGAGPPTADVDS